MVKVILEAQSRAFRSRIAALCSSLLATAYAPSGVRSSGDRTCEWPIDFWCSSSGVAKILSPQPMPQLFAAHPAPSCVQAAPDRAPAAAAMVRMPPWCRRFSMRAPTPGRSRGVNAARASCSRSGVRATKPSGFSISEATLDRYRLVARPTEQRSVAPDLAANRGLDLARQLQRGQQRLLPAQQPASHLIDRHDGRHRKARLDGLHYPMVVVHVKLMPRLDQQDTRAEPLGLADLRPGAHSVLLWPRNWRRCSRWYPPSAAPRPSGRSRNSGLSSCSTDAK